jgi:hypothetical protein
VLVTAPHEWHVALFEIRPRQMTHEVCAVLIETVAGQSLRGLARTERAAVNGCFLLLAGRGSLDRAALSEAA